MHRSPEDLQREVIATERWLDSLDPAAISLPTSDATDLRRLSDAVRASAHNGTELPEQRSAVAAARASGRTWTQIAVFLGVSRDEAAERYSESAARG